VIRRVSTSSPDRNKSLSGVTRNPLGHARRERKKISCDQDVTGSRHRFPVHHAHAPLDRKWHNALTRLVITCCRVTERRDSRNASRRDALRPTMAGRDASSPSRPHQYRGRRVNGKTARSNGHTQSASSINATGPRRLGRVAARRYHLH